MLFVGVIAVVAACSSSTAPPAPRLETATETGMGMATGTPRSPTRQLLVDKVLPNPTCGVQMPSGGQAPLSDDQVNCLRNWIDSL